MGKLKSISEFKRFSMKKGPIVSPNISNLIERPSSELRLSPREASLNMNCISAINYYKKV